MTNIIYPLIPSAGRVIVGEILKTIILLLRSSNPLLLKKRNKWNSDICNNRQWFCSITHICRNL